MLSQLSFFADLNAQELGVLRPLFATCEYPSDTVIFEQGAPAEYLYIVISGEVMVSFKPDDGPHMPVTHIGPGGVVGWSAALGSRRYTSAGLTLADSCMLRVRGNDLRLVFRQYPHIGKVLKERLAQAISQRGSKAHAQASALLELGLNTPELSLPKQETPP